MPTVLTDRLQRAWNVYVAMNTHYRYHRESMAAGQRGQDSALQADGALHMVCAILQFVEAAQRVVVRFEYAPGTPTKCRTR
jgi:hypothetical protein